MEVLLFLSIIFVIASVVGLIVALLQEPGNFSWEIVAGALVLIVIALGCTYATGSMHLENHFHKLHQEYQTRNAAVGVMEEKADVLESDLERLLNSYIDHEGNLISVAGERDLDELRMLFERYPNIQASGNVQQVANEFIKLAEDIATAKLNVNEVARAYNTSQNVAPTSWFAPDDLPDLLQLLETKIP